MQQVTQVVKQKPIFFVVITGVYLILVSLLKWRGISLDILWFITGGLLGIYFLDFAEMFFHVSPSPFRSPLFVGLYTVVSYFVATSVAIVFARGLVLSMYLQIVLWMVGELRLTGTIDTWFRVFSTTHETASERIFFWIVCISFIVVTILSIR